MSKGSGHNYFGLDILTFTWSTIFSAASFGLSPCITHLAISSFDMTKVIPSVTITKAESCNEKLDEAFAHSFRMSSHHLIMFDPVSDYGRLGYDTKLFEL